MCTTHSSLFSLIELIEGFSTMLPSLPRAMRLTGKVPPSFQAVEAVMAILRGSPNGATTREIYLRAAPKSIPRNAVESSSEHPLKSMRHLKKTILATLQEKGVIEKFHVKEEPNVEEEAKVASSSKSKKKKQAANVPKHSWYWRIHEWKQSVVEAKQKEEERTERKAALQASRETSFKASKPV